MRKQYQTPSSCARPGYVGWSRGLRRALLAWALWLVALGASAQIDLALEMALTPDSVRAGDPVTVTVRLLNEGGVTATNVAVRVTLPAGLQYQSYAASAGTWDPGTGMWSLATLSGGTAQDSLVLQTTVAAGVEGLLFAEAEIAAADQADDDSTPDNQDYLEDDIATACTSVPIEICVLAGDTVRLAAPPGLTNYRWYDGPTLVGTDSVYYATTAGRYTWTADSVVSGCGLGSCCPVIIEERCFDLALYKKRAPAQGATADAGDTIIFRITVVNQGDYAADSIRLFDYIPAEASLADADWAASGSGATILLVAGDLLDAGGLAPGDSVNVDIALLLDAPLGANTEVINFAEIQSARTADGRNLTDWDSTPDTILANDIYLVDNYIDGNGKQNSDEDDQDPASVLVNPFDLALWKEPATGQPSVVVPGDTVTFAIHVINQGQVAADSIVLRDYLPAALSLADADWTADGTDAVRTLDAGDELPASGLVPGAEAVVHIRAVLAAPLVGGTEITNYAEIAAAQDILGHSQLDEDSTPDSIPDNDNYLQDNEINGNGLAGGDEDDHDGAAITVADFDLALYKQLAPGEPMEVVPGDTVTFQIIVVNQGDIAADNIEITDSIPAGMTLMDAAWTLSGNLATRLLDAGDELPAGGLAPGQADTVTITLKVPDPLPTGTRLYNWAEISDATQLDGTPALDVDSDMDADLGNDKFLTDDYIDGNGHNGGDEDDHDGAYVMYEVFDIALRKTVNDTLPIHWGDDVTFTITLFNQGTIPMQDIEVYDWIPPGFVLSPNDYNGWLYAGAPDKVRMEVDDLIQPGDSLKIQIVLQAQANHCLEDLVNVAEVTSQENELGVNQNANDIDSYPDKDPTNDTVVDNVIDQDGFNGGDEDDHDVQEPPVFDLALRLTTDRTLPVRIGDTLQYAVKVFNQGNIAAQDVGVKLTLPEGLALSSADANGWTDNGDGTLSNTIADLIARGDSAMLMVQLEVGPTAHLGDRMLYAEIQSARDANGNDRTNDDLDSTPDMDPLNDLLVDDEIRDCGLTDEDDHDKASFDIFDLALRKTPDSNVPAQWFDDVSFTITVFNQSPELSAQQIELVDYIPAGFALSPNDANGWTDNGDSTATLIVPGPIAAGDSIQVQILLQVQKYTPAGTYFNRTEIVAMQDGDGRDLTQYDYDSTPDTDPDNDLEKDDVIDEQGRVAGMDEDDHDPAPVEVEIIDLALRKTTDQTEPVLYQQDVLFTVTVFNQGSRALQDITVIDHVPLGFKLSPNDANGWVYDASQAQATLTVPGLLQPGDSVAVPILLRVQEGAQPYTFDNIAEILSAFDDEGQDRTGDDVDSDWDADPANDNLTDNVIDEDATIGGDEDDHDIANVDVFDLALRKTTSITTPVTVGDDVTFNIELFNQGSVPAANVSLIDHLPQGFALSPNDANGWVDNGDGTVSVTVPAVIAPQSSLVVPLVLRVQPDAEAGVFENNAEITGAEDDEGNDRTAFDLDSHYDTNPANDAWVDNEINDDGDFDEDDHDKAFIEVEIIDLALRKITTYEDMAPVRIGDDVHFAFELFNQGSVALSNVELVDYIPAGFALSPADGNGWTLAGDKAYNLIAGPLMPGESASIGIVLRVTPEAAPDNLINGGELIAAEDASGAERLDDDRDSEADEILGNDVWIDDEIDLTPPADEDDHDFEGVPVFDLALRKTTAQTEPVTVGDDVTWTITVFNQGNLTAENIGLIDYLPEGFALSPNDANGWTVQGDTAAVATVAGPIAPGDSAQIQIVLRVLATAEAGIWYNAAEIRSAQEAGGIDRTGDDLDSTPDEEPGNDNLTDDVITGNGLNGADEDDHDVAPVEVEIIDLALRKTTDHTAPVEDGDDVIFEIEVANQGSVPMYHIGLIDHYPPGFVLSPNDANGWTDNGDGTASLTLPGPIMPGDHYTVGIVLQMPDKLVLGTLPNVAEIVHSEDADGNDRTLDDRDSQADADPTNDAFVDNELNEQPPIDEDDHDIATVFVQGHDLALVKKLVSTGIFEQGDTLDFELTVYNQGNLTAYNIVVTDYLPAGMHLADAGWTDNGGLLTPVAPLAALAPGDSAVWTLALKIDDLFMEDTLTNVAEISSFEDDGGNQPEDIDSTPDTDPDNDTVGGNDLTDNTNGDEDDHDIEGIAVNQRFDLALIKKLATGQPQPVEPGDTVRFTIVVYNQGTLFAHNIRIKDYLPADLIFDPALNTALMTSNPYDWAADATYTIPGPMYPGDAESVDIILIVDSNTDSTKLINKAEIMAADDDTDPNNTPPVDEDSTPDDVDDDFVGGNDFIHNENGDEDDHDFEPIMLIELPRGSIAGLVWFDCDEDGQRTPGEQLLANVPVTLTGTETDGDPVSLSTTTGADGGYLFDELLPGTYTVHFELPADLTDVMFTAWNVGDDATDSDADPATGDTHLVALFGDIVTGLDAGIKDAAAPLIVPVDPRLDNLADGDTLTVACGQEPVFDEQAVAATDNITPQADILIGLSANTTQADSCAADGYVSITEWTWTATDSCGHTATWTVYVKVVDTTPPEVVAGVPAELTLDCGSDLPADEPTFSDACDADLTVLVGSSIAPDGNCGYIVSRSWKAVDDCGNSTTVNQTIYLIDTIAPVITLDHPVYGPLADGDTLVVECGQLPGFDMNSVELSDNCCDSSSVEFVEYVTNGDCQSDGYAYLLHCGWIAEDCCGNTSELFLTIIVEDNTPPELVGVPADLIAQCDDIPPVPDVFALDNCDDDVEVTFGESQTGTGCNMTIIRTWTATDDCGNQTTATQTIVLADNTPPVLVGVPADATFECDDVPAPPDVTATDNCDDDVEVTFGESQTGTDCNKTIVRTWTATDDCGNQTTATQTITLIDNTAPVLAGVPDDTTVECDDIPPAAAVTATDNCDGDVPVQMTESTQPLDGCSYYILRTWTATDDCGNTAMAQQTLLVTDTTPPTFVNAPADLTVECDAIPAVPDLTAIDNCDEDVTVEFLEFPQDPACMYQIKRVWTATDACGNFSSHTQIITVKDTEGPVITTVDPALAGLQPGDTLTAECDNVPVLSETSATAEDNCSEVTDFVFLEQVVGGGNCPDDGYLVLMRCGWEATDACGNTSTFYIYVKVVDTTPPLVMDVPADVTVECDAIPPAGSVTVMDNCDDEVEVAFAETTEPGDCPHSYTIVRTWTATDHCGNTATATQIVTVEDTTPPTLEGVPADLTVSCSAIPPVPTVTAADNCDSAPEMTFAETATDGCPYTITRTWTATDACGNVTQLSQTITVVDEVAPVLEGVPADLTVDCDAIPSVPTVTATDNCDDAVEVAFAETTEPGDCPHSYTIVRTWTATDWCGNVTQLSQNITVVDDEAPVLAGLPDDLTVECSQLPAPADVTATDNCDDAVVVELTETQTDGCPFTLTRTWTATDACGNQTTATQTIYVYDDTPPVFLDDPADITVNCGEVPEPQDCIATDNCTDSVAVTFVELMEPMDECTYQIKRLWEAEDECGNTAVVDQLITVIDSEAPVIEFTHPLLAGAEDGDEVFIECDELVVFSAADAAATDNCDPDPQVEFIETGAVTGDCATDGFLTSLTCTWAATDACGNADSITLIITIVDTKAPEFVSVPADLTVECGAPLPALEQPEAFDGCGEVSYSVDSTIVTGNCPNNYQIIRTWTATDACGNSATAQQVITVQDTQAPLLGTPPADLTVDLTAGETVPPATALTATDACDGDVQVEFAEAEYPDDCFYVLQRTWSAVDACGNYASVTQTITVLQGLEPVGVTVTPDSCDAQTGTAAFTPETYTYLWPDLVEGAARNDLGAGTYEVTVTNGVCETVVAIEIGNDCQVADCPDLLPAEDAIEAAIDTAGYCLPVPFDMIGNYEVYRDGAPVALTDLAPCNMDTAVFYSYALLPNQGTAGPYQVQWTIDGQVFETTVNDMDELASWMNSTDATSMWMHNAASFGLMGGDPAVPYGNLEVVHVPTQVPTTLQPNFVFVPLGTELTVVGEGVHELVLAQTATGCADTMLLNFVVNAAPPLPDDILADEFIAFSFNCDVAAAEYCLDIPYVDMGGYELYLNGQPFSGALEGCDYRLQATYTWANVPGQGVEGPYEVQWTVNGQTFSGTFQTMDELVALMNLWDPAGAWTLEPATQGIIGGAVGTAYSALTIVQLATGAEAVLEKSTVNLPQGTRITFAQGMNQLVVRRLADGLTDTLTAAVACTTPEFLATYTYVGRVDTLCFDTSQLMGALVSITNMCEYQSDFSAEFDWLEGTNCVVCTGMTPGNDQACFVLCDEYGICDTVYLQVEVRDESQVAPTAAADTLTTVRNLPATLDLLANDIRPAGTQQLTIVTQPNHGTAIVNPDGTVTYTPAEDYCDNGDYDVFVYQICNDYGCDATVVYVRVLCDEVVIYTGFSPNGDGVNDTFRIEGLERFQTRRLSIFNRWGTLVYFNENYDNTWTGKWQGRDLPDGTYFYLLELDGGRVLSGYLQINR